MQRGATAAARRLLTVAPFTGSEQEQITYGGWDELLVDTMFQVLERIISNLITAATVCSVTIVTIILFFFLSSDCPVHWVQR